jgi:hypothetical protein
VNFLDDAERGVREMARVTLPGGAVAACVWDYAREIEADRVAAAYEGVVMRWCRDGELASCGRQPA